MIAPISFGKKIPISNVNIYDRRNDKYIPATVYELDCMDKEDIDIVKYNIYTHCFNERMADSMEAKYLFYKSLFCFQGDSLRELIMDMPDKNFYILETPYEEVIGICQVKEKNEDRDLVEFLESGGGEAYKYVGQNLLAVVAKCAAALKKDIEISLPVDDKFYTEKCGFRKMKPGPDLEMNPDEIDDFVKKVETRTQGKIIDIRA